MTRRHALRDEFRLAARVPAWAWRFYRRRVVTIAGLSLVPSVQRLVAVNWGDRLPGAVSVVSEVAVGLVRLTLLALIARWVLRGRRLSWAHAARFSREHWPSLAWQAGFLAVAFLIFDVVAEKLVLALLPATAHDLYLGTLLFVKNPTVIAFTFVWMVGVVRQLFSPQGQSASRATAPA